MIAPGFWELVLAMFLTVMSGFLALFALVFGVIFICDKIADLRRQRRLKKARKLTRGMVEELDTYFDKITEYRNELS